MRPLFFNTTANSLAIILVLFLATGSVCFGEEWSEDPKEFASQVGLIGTDAEEKLRSALDFANKKSKWFEKKVEKEAWGPRSEPYHLWGEWTVLATKLGVVVREFDDAKRMSRQPRGVWLAPESLRKYRLKLLSPDRCEELLSRSRGRLRFPPRRQINKRRGR